MTEQEWPLFAAEVEATFRGGLEEDRELALREHFGAVPLEDARACIRHLVMNGQVWVPTPAELVQALRSTIGGNGWHFRRVLAGRSEAEQTALDHVTTCRALGVEPDHDVLEQLSERRLLDA